MGKHSVYITDDLLEDVRNSLRSVESTSKLVQRGLRALIDTEGPSRNRPPPPGVDAETLEQIPAVRDRLRAEAEAEFAKGYDTGVDLLGRVGWEVAERLSWAKGLGNMEQVLDDDRYEAMFEWLQESALRLEGFRQAVRDLVGATWDEVSSYRSSRRYEEVGLEDR